jgi:hypothetical protein
VNRPADHTPWRASVANSAEPVLQPEEPAPVVEPVAPELPEQPELEERPGAEERYVPPPPPPLPRVPKDRLAAWIGVLVSPVLLLIAALLRISIPSLAAWALVIAFLGGFGYLVANMPRGPRDPYDDGAVL